MGVRFRGYLRTVVVYMIVDLVIFLMLIKACTPR